MLFRSEKTLFCDAFSCSFYKSEQFARYLAERFEKVEHMTLIRGSKHEKKIIGRNARIKDMARWATNASPKGEKQ